MLCGCLSRPGGRSWVRQGSRLCGCGIANCAGGRGRCKDKCMLPVRFCPSFIAKGDTEG